MGFGLTKFMTYGQLRIAGLYALVGGQTTQPHIPMPTEEKIRVHCVFHPKKQKHEKAPNLEVFLWF
jgi:hypothetical protein